MEIQNARIYLHYSRKNKILYTILFCWGVIKKKIFFFNYFTSVMFLLLNTFIVLKGLKTRFKYKNMFTKTYSIPFVICYFISSLWCCYTVCMFRLLSDFLNNISIMYTFYNIFVRKFIISEHIVSMVLHVYQNLDYFEQHATYILLDSLHICFHFIAGI